MSGPGLLAMFTEGDRVRGLGHVSRCSAYARGWLGRGGTIRWILDGDEAAAAAIGAGQEIVRRRWQEDGATADGGRPAVALVDSYVASFSAMEAIGAAAGVAVFIDDLNRDYPPGIVVHPAPDRAESAKGGGGAWLQGPAWQPLRPAFWDLPPRASIRPEIERILIVFGGGDLRGMSAAAARLVADLCPAAGIDLVLGAGQAAPDPMPGLTVHRAIDDGAMATLMERADIAISGAGQTVFELARCGTPAVLVGIADNQQANLDHWPALCGYVSAGPWDSPDLDVRLKAGISGLADPGRRQTISRAAAGLVDGQGVSRLFDHLEQATLQEIA